MSSLFRKLAAVIRSLLFVCLLCSGADVEAQTGVQRPAAPTPAALSTSTEASVGTEENLVTYQLKHARAADISKIMRDLVGEALDDGKGFVVDERTNSLLYRSHDVISPEFEEFCSSMDTPTPSQGDTTSGKSTDLPALGPQPQVFSFFIGFERGESVESLKQHYNELEKQTHQLADKLKQITSRPPYESELGELKTAVHKSFEARQALQRAELADLAQRMKSMQQSIDMRDKLADKVVERRVEDLLNPNLTWDTTPSQEPKSPAADESKVSISTSPSQSSIQAAVTRLLTQLPHFKTPQGDVATSPIAFLGIDYQGPWSLGDFRDKLQKEIEAQISQSSSCSLVSRRMTEAAMAETRVKPTDVVTPLVQKNLTQSLRNMDIKVQGLVVARLKHLGDSDSTQNGEFEVSLELFDVSLQSYKERATARNDRSSSKSREEEPQLLQGRWIIESWSWELEDQLSNAENQFELRIDGPAIHVFDDIGNQYSSMLLDEQNIEPAAYNGSACPVNYVIDPNGDRIVCPGILELDGERLRICYSINSLEGADSDKFRPSLFIPGSKVTLIECRRAPADAAKAAASNEVDLSTPQATLDTIHRYSVDHPMGVPVECYTEAALQELSGVMLQQLCFMSGLSQVGLKTGGIIGVKDNAPLVAGTAPSFHLSVDALLKKHSLPTPPEECTKAFELLAKLTLGAAFGNGESRVKPDRELFRLAAGILKSPKDFLPKAGELSKRFNDISGDTESPKKESKAQPKYLIKIDGDEATATQIIDSDKPSVPMSFKLQRINQRWLVSEVFSDEILNQMISSMSQVLGAMSAIESEVANQSDSSDSKQSLDAEKPLYSGHSLSWWLDSYWDNATANPKTAEYSAQEYVASEAIRKLRELPECKAAIEAALAKWFASVEHEVNEIQLTRAAKCIVFAAGPKNQKLAVDYLFEIAKRVPINPGEENLGKWIDCWDDELDKAVKELVLNDELATQIADRLQTGNSAQRRFAVAFLLNRGASKQSDTPDQTEANAWFRSHDKLFYPAFEAALQDSSEAIRMFALIVLTGIDPHNSQLPFQLKTAIESDPSTQVRCVAIPLLCSKELAYSIEAQSVELQPLLMKALHADSSVDVRDAALGALMAMDKDSELVHATLLRWARCKERVQVEYALTLMLRNHEAGDRPQSIDELIELFSDPEWGTKVEVNYNNWSTHHRWARQYAIAILGKYAAHAHRALPTLEAELARNNKDTLSFATEALDRVRGYCPDLPIDKLQGEWEFVSMQKPESSSPFFELQASSDQQPSSVITISGTQLKLGDRVLAELSHYRSGSRLGVALLLDPDGKMRHCHGGHNFKGGPSPEYKPNVAPAPELLILEVSELLNNWDATQATKQIYEFRRVIGEPKLEAPTP